MIKGDDLIPGGEPEPTTILVTVEQPSVMKVFTEPGALDPLIEQIEKLALSFQGDVSTAKGREAIASMAYKVVRTKTYLDGLGKKLVDDLKAVPKKIDENRKSVRDRLDALRDKVRADLTTWEQNQERLEQSINDLRFTPLNFMERTAEQLATRVEFLETANPTAENFGDLLPVAEQAIADALVILREQLRARREYDSSQVELETLRREKAEREEAERKQQEADRIRKEAVANAERALEDSRLREERAQKDRQDAEARLEREKVENAERLEREKAESAEREKRATEEATRREQERQEQERRAQAAEDAKRAADEEHRRKLNREALASLTLVVQQSVTPAGESANDSIAKAVLTAIIRRQVPHITIRY